MLNAQTIANNLTNVIVNPIIALLFACGLLMFAWGIIQFLMGLNTNGDMSKEDGKRHMLWGIVGMFVMVSAYAILKLVDSTVGSNVIQ